MRRVDMDRIPQQLVVKLLDRKVWGLVEDFYYIDPELGIIKVPSGFESDFATVPRLPIIFDMVGAYGHAASVLHDYLYDKALVSRKEADVVFYNALRSTGHARWRSWIMYLGVRLFGKQHYRGK